MSEDPAPPPVPPRHPAQPASPLAAYNVVTDTVVGVNLRWRDNLFQAVFIVVAVGVCAATGGLIAALNARWGVPWIAGAFIGGGAGLVLGLFASGFILMIYRGVRHMRGKHE